MANNDIDAERLALDREKWQAEKSFRDRELALKERDQKIYSWTNPLTVAVSVGALAWFGNLAATWWNGRLQRVVEENKAESERILEMIKTGDASSAATNLKFLLDAGLIASSARVKKLRDYLDKTPARSGPALPAAGARFSIEPTEALPGASAAALQINLNTFIAHLDKVGFPSDTQHVQIRVQELSEPDAKYYFDERMIVIDRRIVDDPYPAHREFMHHVLFATKRGYQRASMLGGIESGLADYFSASFSGNPRLGSAHTARTLGFDQPFVRRLDNNLKYTPYRLGDEPHPYGEMWGGTFWDIRKDLGLDLADRLLTSAWQSMSWPVEETEITGAFVRSLFNAAGEIGGDAAMGKIRGVLQARRVPT